MKSYLLRLLIMLSLSANLPRAAAQGTAFTYQGQLASGTNPVNGHYDMTFSLFATNSGGSALAGPVNTNGVAVVGGLFTVTVDFGPVAAFIDPTNNNWLQIGVRTNGGSTFTNLVPRQQLTPTPYAIYAEGANAAGISGAGLTGVNAAELNGLTAANFWQLTGNAGTTPGVNFLGTPDNQALELHVDGQRAFRLEPGLFGLVSIPNVIGGSLGNYVVPGTLGATIGGGGTTDAYDVDDTNVVSANFSTIAGGVGNIILNPASEEATIGGGFKNSINNGTHATISGGYLNSVSGYAGTVPGGENNVAGGPYSFAAGHYANALNDGSFVWADDSSSTPYASTGPNQFQIRATGGVGIGTANGPQQYLSVHGGINIDQANLNAGFVNNGNTNGYGLTFGSSSGEGIASERVPGANQYGLDLYTDFAARMSIAQNGTIQVNQNDLYLYGSSTNNDWAGLGYRTSVAGVTVGPGGAGPFLWGYDGGALGTVLPDEVNLTWDYSGNIWISNNCSVASLTIRGGADLAEPFTITVGDAAVLPGAVVVIDEQNPGHLKASDQPYDTRVAGVVSGANGIHPGIQMQQQGLAEGGKNIALTGRVYVQADASNGAIHPGDLLTTSNRPGYAMKVTDHVKAQGAILGKAMTGLNENQGMVLVLVTLQ